MYVTHALLFLEGCRRVGVIATGMTVLWSLLYDPVCKLSLKKLKWYILYAAVILSVLFLSGTAQAFLSRMFDGIPASGHRMRIQQETDTDPSENRMQMQEKMVHPVLI